MNKMKMTGLALVAAIGIAGGGCSLQNLNTQNLVTAGSQAMQAMTITDEQMANYVHQYVVQMDAQNKVCADTDPYAKRLAAITAGITSADGIPLNFKVYKTNDVNAFACADGSVRVYTGLMDLMTDEEVLGVIGHEVGHVAHHHTKKAFKQALMNTAFRNLAASGGGIIGTLSASQLGALGDQLLQSQYSRKQESDADNYAYDFLKSHGKDPRGMISSLQKLQQIDGSSASKSSAFQHLFSTHPEIEKRIADLEKRYKKENK